MAFYVATFALSVVCTIQYDRQQLLELRGGTGGAVSAHVASLCLNFDDFPYRKTSDNEGRHARKRGKRGGVLARLRRHCNRPPLPTIHLANVQSIDNKLDELKYRLRYHRDLRECCVLCLTETWLDANTPSAALEQMVILCRPYRCDRDKEITNKTRGGGVCLMVIR